MQCAATVIASGSNQKKVALDHRPIAMEQMHSGAQSAGDKHTGGAVYRLIALPIA